ncbi:hypothetical protein ACOSQ4_023627 [Xanthoceras sorbifolium]
MHLGPFCSGIVTKYFYHYALRWILDFILILSAAQKSEVLSLGKGGRSTHEIPCAVKLKRIEFHDPSLPLPKLA